MNTGLLLASFTLLRMLCDRDWQEYAWGTSRHIGQSQQCDTLLVAFASRSLAGYERHWLGGLHIEA